VGLAAQSGSKVDPDKSKLFSAGQSATELGNMTKKGPEPTALQRLIDEPKGNTDHLAGEAFILYVFWEAPTHEAAHNLLSALARCAAATRRDTPCVPTYFFRISNNTDLCRPAPKTIEEHPQLMAALAKIKRGVPLPAVRADLVRRGLDPSLLDLDPKTELPSKLQEKPVALEFTELYLDERAFNQHAGSRDYLDAYGEVMNPGFQNCPPKTVRLGTPSASLVEKILEPMLHEIVIPQIEGSTLWRRPQACDIKGSALFLSLDVLHDGDDSATARLATQLSSKFLGYCTTCMSFAHPLREGTGRLICTMASCPPQEILAELKSLRPVRGEAFIDTSDKLAAAVAKTSLAGAELGIEVSVNASESVGYVLHDKAAELLVVDSYK